MSDPAGFAAAIADTLSDGALITHTADEVSQLSDAQILILWAGAHEWITEGRRSLTRGQQQLKAIEAEISKRGIKKKPLGECL